MTETRELSYTLSQEQVFFLTQLLDLKPVFGFEDPFKGYLVDEIQARFELVMQELQALQYARLNEEGKWEIEALLSACLFACGGDDGIQLAKRTPEGHVYQANLYFTPHIVTEMSPSSEREGHLVFRPLSDARRTVSELFRFFPDPVEASDYWYTDLEDMMMDDWMKLTVEEQADLLGRKGLEEDRMLEILNAYHVREGQGAMRKWKRERHYWFSAGIYYYVIEDSIVLASEQRGRKLRFQTYRFDDVKEFLTTFAFRFVEAYNEEADAQLELLKKRWVSELNQ